MNLRCKLIIIKLKLENGIQREFYILPIPQVRFNLLKIRKSITKAYVLEPRYPVGLCLNDKTLKLSIRVRAFNVKGNDTLYGNWTDKDSFVCWESSSSWTVPVIVMGAIFFVIVLAYTAKTYVIRFCRCFQSLLQ